MNLVSSRWSGPKFKKPILFFAPHTPPVKASFYDLEPLSPYRKSGVNKLLMHNPKTKAYRNRFIERKTASANFLEGISLETIAAIE